MSNMKTNSQAGYVSGTLISLIMSIIFLVGALSFGAWAFMSRQDYKNHSDRKALKAADERQKATEDADAVKYAEAAKSPLTTHKAPDQYGGITVQYPKTWSAYVIEEGSGTNVVEDYFHPGAVPNVNNRDNAFALRVEVVSQTYDKVLKTFDNGISTHKVVAAPYAFAKVPSVIGTRLDGEIVLKKQGSMIIVPMRNLTLKVWTESPTYLADFNNIILPNLTFSP
jgi:hypothetical protein